MTKAQIEAHWFLWIQGQDPSAEDWDDHYLSLANADDADDGDKKYYKQIVIADDITNEMRSENIEIQVLNEYTRQLQETTSSYVDMQEEAEFLIKKIRTIKNLLGYEHAHLLVCDDK